MRKSILFLCALVYSVSLFSQEKMYIHKSDKITLGALISKTDSVSFSNDGTVASFCVNGSAAEYEVANIDSISFGADSDTISVYYNGNSATVVNPLAFEGVSVSVSGADVTVDATTDTKDINYKLSGTCSDGMFKVYSEKRFNLLLCGVSIINNDGPAINIQANNKVSVMLAAGTSNSLTDGTTYADPPTDSEGEEEDQDGAFFSEGKLVFSGTGSLTINGKGTGKHGLCSDDEIEFYGGTVTVSSALKDGVHANDGIIITDGTINVTSTGDAIDADEGYLEISGGNITTVNSEADVKGLACDSIMTISGGTVNVTVNGNQSKAIKAGQVMTLSGGTIDITAKGGVVLESSGSGYDPSYCTAIKCDNNVNISGSNITITSTGAGGKGISSDTDINLTSGSLIVTSSGSGTTYKNENGKTDSYSASCLTADNINIIGGSLTTKSSGNGGKGIKADTSVTIGDSTNSPTISITTSGSKFVVSGSDYCHPKAIVCDSKVTVSNGTTSISSSDDGIHAENTYTQDGGTVTISKSYEGVEAMYIYMNAGELNVVASNDAMNATAGTVSGGTESNDGSCLYVNGGTLVATCTAGDAIDSNGNVLIKGGTTIANGPKSGVEEACDFNGTFSISGGFFIGAGSNSNMTKAMSSSSTQVNMLIKSNSSISSSSMLHIQNSSGTDLLSFTPENGGYYFLFSSSSLAKGASYSIYTGGTYTGGTDSNGLRSGGTYSSGTLKKTVTLSSSSTVNTISF